jgi:dihydrofolate synthase / folylpolyglutamate synthase
MTFDNLESITNQFVSASSVIDFIHSRKGATFTTDQPYESHVFPVKIKKFFEKLDNPQKKIKVIHVAGTSGKGSTCNFASHILTSQGFRVGMTVSPHLQRYNERIQINNIQISDQKLVQYFKEIYPIFIQTESEIVEKISSFEILIALTFWTFWKEGVDYAVIEVGLGGLLDATNIDNSNKICILNSIGLDHVRLLGETLELIAEQKSGIIQEGNLAVTLSQSAGVNKVFQETADKKAVELEFIFSGMDFEQPITKFDKETGKPSLIFDYVDSELETHTFELKQIGDYQASNCALAIRAAEIAADRDGWEIDWKKIADELKITTFGGRFQLYDLPNKSLLIIDGAHNPQKMNGFTSSVSKYFPERRFDWIIGFKNGKDVESMIDEILRYKRNINKIILTEFDTGSNKNEQDIISINVEELAMIFQSHGFTNFEVEKNLPKLISVIKNSSEDYIITGSLYLVGNALNVLNN